MLNDVDCVGKLRDTEGFVPFKVKESDFPSKFCSFVPLNSIFDTVLSEFNELWDGASCRLWRSQTRALENHS